MLHWKWLAMVGVTTLASVAIAQSEALLVKRATELRQGPSETTASVASLPVQSAVARMAERQGPWMQVKTEAGQVGWVHMFDVTTAAAQSSTGINASGAFRGLSKLFSSSGTKSNANVATSTIGIRGLGAEDIANAQPNLESIKRAEALRADAAQAKSFAKESQLAARTVEPLPAPQPQAGAKGSDSLGIGKSGGGK